MQGLAPGLDKGVFALTTLKPGLHILDYTGETLAQEDFEARYPGASTEASYTFALENGTYLDATDPDYATAARWINHSKQPNATVEENAEGTLEIRTTRTIMPGEEILIDYNPDSSIDGFEWTRQGCTMANPTNHPISPRTPSMITTRSLQSIQHEQPPNSSPETPDTASGRPDITLRLTEDTLGLRGLPHICYYDLSKGVDTASCTLHPACFEHQKMINTEHDTCPMCTTQVGPKPTKGPPLKILTRADNPAWANEPSYSFMCTYCTNIKQPNQTGCPTHPTCTRHTKQITDHGAPCPACATETEQNSPAFTDLPKHKQTPQPTHLPHTPTIRFNRTQCDIHALARHRWQNQECPNTLTWINPTLRRVATEALHLTSSLNTTALQVHPGHRWRARAHIEAAFGAENTELKAYLSKGMHWADLAPPQSSASFIKAFASSEGTGPRRLALHAHEHPEIEEELRKITNTPHMRYTKLITFGNSSNLVQPPREPWHTAEPGKEQCGPTALILIETRAAPSFNPYRFTDLALQLTETEESYTTPEVPWTYLNHLEMPDSKPILPTEPIAKFAWFHPSPLQAEKPLPTCTLNCTCPSCTTDCPGRVQRAALALGILPHDIRDRLDTLGYDPERVKKGTLVNISRTILMASRDAYLSHTRGWPTPTQTPPTQQLNIKDAIRAQTNKIPATNSPGEPTWALDLTTIQVTGSDTTHSHEPAATPTEPPNNHTTTLVKM